MAKFILKNANVRFNEIDLTGLLNSINMDHTVEAKDADTFDISSKRRLPGLESINVSHNGFWDNANSEDLEMFSMLGNGPLIYSVTPEGNTVGNIAYTLKAQEAQYSPGAAIGEVFGFNLDLQSTGNLIRGRLGATGAKVATGNGSALSLGAVSSTQSLYASLHVIGASADTLDVTIESDDNSGFTTAVVRGTFTQVTSIPTSQQIIVAGPFTDTFWRVVWTLGTAGPYTIFVVVGIR